MAMHIVCIQMNGHKHLIPIAPHLSGGCFSDFKCLLRGDFARLKTLYSVVPDHLATKSKPMLYSNHFDIGILLGAVYTAHIHFTVGLIIVFSVRKRRIQIIVKIFSCSGLVGIVGIVKRCF